jgi:leucyl-tRNA synthetase
VEWDTNGLVGMQRFLDRVWNYYDNYIKNNSLDFSDDESLASLNKTIKKVSEAIEAMKFNTAVSSMIQFLNFIYAPLEPGIKQIRLVTVKDFKNFVIILSPFAPHLCEELWSLMGNSESISKAKWPEAEERFLIDKSYTLAIQVNGKLRDTIVIESEASEEDVKQSALASEKIQKWLDGKEPKKIIYVKGKLVSIVV